MEDLTGLKGLTKIKGIGMTKIAMMLDNSGSMKQKMPESNSSVSKKSEVIKYVKKFTRNLADPAKKGISNDVYIKYYSFSNSIHSLGEHGYGDNNLDTVIDSYETENTGSSTRIWDLIIELINDEGQKYSQVICITDGQDTSSNHDKAEATAACKDAGITLKVIIISEADSMENNDATDVVTSVASSEELSTLLDEIQQGINPNDVRGPVDIDNDLCAEVLVTSVQKYGKAKEGVIESLKTIVPYLENLTGFEKYTPVPTVLTRNLFNYEASNSNAAPSPDVNQDIATGLLREFNLGLHMMLDSPPSLSTDNDIRRSDDDIRCMEAWKLFFRKANLHCDNLQEGAEHVRFCAEGMPMSEAIQHDNHNKLIIDSYCDPSVLMVSSYVSKDATLRVDRECNCLTVLNKILSSKHHKLFQVGAIHNGEICFDHNKGRTCNNYGVLGSLEILNNDGYFSASISGLVDNILSIGSECIPLKDVQKIHKALSDGWCKWAKANDPYRKIIKRRELYGCFYPKGSEEDIKQKLLKSNFMKENIDKVLKIIRKRNRGAVLIDYDLCESTYTELIEPNEGLKDIGLSKYLEEVVLHEHTHAIIEEMRNSLYSDIEQHVSQKRALVEEPIATWAELDYFYKDKVMRSLILDYANSGKYPGWPYYGCLFVEKQYQEIGRSAACNLLDYHLRDTALAKKVMDAYAK